MYAFLSPGRKAAGILVTFSVIAVAATAARQDQVHEHQATGGTGSPASLVQIPHPMVVEHEELHRHLEQALAAGGETGEAAKEVADHLGPHFVEENEIALPPLGVLRTLVKEGATPEMRPAMELGRKVEQHLDRFVEEHASITEALNRLEAAAEREDKQQHAEFARDLRLHAQMEEEVLYPAAILIGRYLERELGQDQPKP